MTFWKKQSSASIFSKLPEHHKELVTMLTYCRPAGSKTEMEFIQRYIEPLGAKPDAFGNYILKVGPTEPHILWSSHTDTVHRQDGKQQVEIADSIIGLSIKTKSSCLGADCSTGVWIMRQMIKRNIPGLYIFHREEECGGNGSNHIAYRTPEILSNIKAAIAFDRKGYTDIITHQMGGRCASDKFAKSMSLLLPGSYVADQTGSFTDTANYTDLVPECSNLSVGYHHAHSPDETQDMRFADFLLNGLCKLDQSKIVISRDPRIIDDFHHHRWSDHLGSANRERTTMETIVREHPRRVADLLRAYGLTEQHLLDELGLYGSDFDH